MDMSDSSRQVLIVGNWKMNHTQAEVKQFFQELHDFKRQDIKGRAWIAPQFIHLSLVQQLGALAFKIGAQNCSHENHGAYTGDVSPQALKEMNVDFVIVGHSERRAFFKENDRIINSKLHRALENKLKVILCVGETLDQRQSGKTLDVLQDQLREGLKGVSADQWGEIILAYEPVWAIGTGQTATPEQAQEVHLALRMFLEKELHAPAQQILILYGGSVKPSNIAELLEQPDIDGALVGGASLKASDYKTLCQVAFLS